MISNGILDAPLSRRIFLPHIRIPEVIHRTDKLRLRHPDELKPKIQITRAYRIVLHHHLDPLLARHETITNIGTRIIRRATVAELEIFKIVVGAVRMDIIQLVVEVVRALALFGGFEVIFVDNELCLLARVPSKKVREVNPADTHRFDLLLRRIVEW